MNGKGTDSRDSGSGGANPGKAGIALEDVRQNRGLASSLGGSCVAILTFLLFFLYPRLAAGEVNPILFRVTVGGIVVSLYLFAFASLDYFSFYRALSGDASRAKNYLVRADRLTGAGILILVLAPALILFTINLLDLAFLALALWIAFFVLVLVSSRKFGI